MRAFEVLRAAYGTAEVLAPGAAECFLIGRAPDAHARTFIRVLGARHLLQAAAATTLGGGAALHWISAGVDALHALTMLALAAVDRRRRQPAVANAAIALAFAAGELRSGTRAGVRSQISCPCGGLTGQPVGDCSVDVLVRGTRHTRMG
ncbi:hypothetical protein ACFFGR_05495 [Arthrobacter liuii]|uniref:Uncharacterized protein n=1 Tax=Arthrobacter liuii TaxID=1476996 RepID=A0ABQ2AID7_9MICC|nr:hypothetical protein [Arthrobacter liuii]GGH91626.1 hypothetical protein GCM10007170_08220 [Arthrobacter liuii]